MRILLVEDDAELAGWLEQSLTRRGIVVEWEDNGRLAERRIIAEAFDVVVLDLGLPSRDGASVLRRIRAASDTTPVLIATARDNLVERVALLHDGADDFLNKPFAVEELEARLVALFRRSRGRARGVWTCGALTYDEAALRFTLAGGALPLSPREHAVLRALVQHAGHPLSKQQILDRLVSSEGDLQVDAIEVIIHRLRRKLGDKGVQVVTLRGLGYLLEAGDA